MQNNCILIAKKTPKQNNPIELSVAVLCQSHVSLLSKSLRFLDGEQELLSELFQASVWRQVQTIEAGRTDRQLALTKTLNDFWYLLDVLLY